MTVNKNLLVYDVTYLDGSRFTFKAASVENCIIIALAYAIQNRIPKVITSIELEGKIIVNDIEITYGLKND
jgi:hypothetical protein